MKAKVRIIAVILLIAIIAVGFYFFKFYRNQKALTHSTAKTPIIVSFATAQSDQWHNEVKSIGTVSTRKGVTLRAEVPGRVTRIYYPSSTLVEKGKALFQINPKVLAAELKEFEAKLELSKFRHARLKRLYKENVVSLETLIQSKSKLDLNKAQVETSRQRLVLSTIHAPYDGVLGLRKVNVGDYVKQGEILATFQSSTELRVDFSIPQKYIKAVKKGYKVRIKFNEDPPKEYTGIVYAINPIINRGTRMLDVRASLTGENLLPGMFAEVELMLKPERKVIIIPQTAVVKSLYGDYVYKVIDGKAVKTPIAVGQRRGNFVEVTKGIAPGAVVVSAGQLKIQNNSPVTDKGALIIKGNLKRYDAPVTFYAPVNIVIPAQAGISLADSMTTQIPDRSPNGSRLE